jgi:hypothetical protein
MKGRTQKKPGFVVVVVGYLGRFLFLMYFGE